MQQTILEGTGDKFSIADMIEARRQVFSAVYAIADKVVVGMIEEDARAMARQTLKDLGLRRGWHQIIVRFGTNTTLSFHDRSMQGVALREDDIYFVDIGPIVGDCEGDAGDTFVIGNNREHRRAQSDVREIWHSVRAHWLRSHATGIELYDFARQEAKARGWKLNMDLSGHRLSDFPHSVHFDGSMADVDFWPNANLWVLEIAIADPEMSFGAFFEDLLLEDELDRQRPTSA